jgi:MFS family permease
VPDELPPAGDVVHGTPSTARRGGWITRSLVGILLATFFSDVSHEMATAVLPMYVSSLGLARPAAALGIIEGVADLLVSLSKLAGGLVGHLIERKRPLAALGYLVTTLATASMGLARGLVALVTLRTVAWSARGFRSPLRDFLLADAVEPTHFGRAYGLERAGDMLGAVTGPLIALALLQGGIGFQKLMLITLVPGIGAAAAIYFLVRDRSATTAKLPTHLAADPTAVTPTPKSKLPRTFWLLLGGVVLFGLGDFSRTFLVLLIDRAASPPGDIAATEGSAAGISAAQIAILLYAVHNLISAAAAYPVGHLGDRRPKMNLLIGGYCLGVATNVLFALFHGSLAGLCVAVLLSGVYIAIEETLEKAVVAELLPREVRSLGFGILASANAVGDMVSSLGVGLLIDAGRPGLAFSLVAAAGAAGAVWLIVLKLRGGTRA